MSAATDPPPRSRAIRIVPARRALDWYGEAMRLFNRHPLRFVGLAVALIAAELLLGAIPVAGRPLANVVVPILACGLLYASLAVDRGDRPRAAHLVAPFAAPVNALAAVILSALAVFLAEWVVAWRASGVNLLDAGSEVGLSVGDVMLVYTVGVIVSLPLTLVPMFALFEGAGIGEAFGASVAAFGRNARAFFVFGAAALALLGLAIVTMGILLPVVLPLWAASSYAAWKDLTGATAGGSALRP